MPEPSSPPPTETPEANSRLEQAVFRHTFLGMITDPDGARGLLGCAKLLYPMAVTYCGHWPPTGESCVAEELRRAAADLRYLEHWFHQVAHRSTTDRLEAEDKVLSAMARGWAQTVAALAEAVEAALGPPPGGVGADVP